MKPRLIFSPSDRLKGNSRRAFCAGVLLLLILPFFFSPNRLHAQLPAEIKACSSSEDGGGRPRFAFYQRPDGKSPPQLTGYSVEFLRQLLAPQGIALHAELLPWKRCLDAVAAGDFAVVLDANLTPERQTQYRVSSPYYQQKKLYVYARNKPFGAFTSLAALRPLRVCGQLGKDYSGWGLTGINIDRGSRTLEQGLMKIKLGRCEVVLTRPEAIDFYRPSAGPDGLSLDRFAWRELPGVPAIPSGFLVSRNLPYSAALADLLETGIAQMQRDGRKKAIEDRFLK
jgi:polar amino acid transport system substrate-binding protein